MLQGDLWRRVSNVFYYPRRSLPRSAKVRDLLFCREQGESYLEESFDAAMSDAVDAVVSRQVDIGIDVVSAGETSKIGYATYIKDRLTGFEGDNPRQPALDLKDYPEFRERMAIFAGKQTFKRQSCVGPITFVGSDDLSADLCRMRKAVDAHSPTGAFLNAASPGVVAAFQPNRYYPSTTAFVGRDRVIAGTDCGFGTFAGIGKMDAEISYRKLSSLVEGAAMASERLWRAA